MNISKILVFSGLSLAATSSFGTCNLYVKNANELLSDRGEFFDLGTKAAEKGYVLLETKKEVLPGDLTVSDFISLKDGQGKIGFFIKGMTVTEKRYCMHGNFFGGCYYSGSMTKSFSAEGTVLIDRIRATGVKPVAKVSYSWAMKNKDVAEDIENGFHGRFLLKSQKESLFKLVSVLPACGTLSEEN